MLHLQRLNATNRPGKNKNNTGHKKNRYESDRTAWPVQGQECANSYIIDYQ